MHTFINDAKHWHIASIVTKAKSEVLKNGRKEREEVNHVT